MTPPTDPTMQIPSPELVRRIESLVSSLLGVTRSRVERDESGAIHALHASVAPGHSPERVRREIRSALLSSLDLDLAPDVVEVEVEEQRGRRQEQFWEGPDRARDEVASNEDRSETGEEPDPEDWLARADASPRAGKGRPAEDRRAPGDRRTPTDRRGPEDRRSGSDRRALDETPERPTPADLEEERAERMTASEARELFERRTPKKARGSATPVEGVPGDEGVRGDETSGPGRGPVARREAESPTSDGLLPLSLGEYVLLGGGGDDVGVELRIRVLAGGDRFVGTVRVATLEDVSPGLFVGATLRAVEQALDARPVTERSARILILEAVDMEEVVLREGRFLAATVQAVHRDGESRATGLVPAEGRVLREAAAEAALDAVTRILEGRHTRRVEGRGRIRRGPGSPPDGRWDERGGRSGPRNSAADRDVEGRPDPGGSTPGTIDRDPFHVWE